MTELGKMLIAAAEETLANPTCGCIRCLEARGDEERLRLFIVCLICGNKRCPPLRRPPLRLHRQQRAGPARQPVRRRREVR